MLRISVHWWNILPRSALVGTTNMKNSESFPEVRNTKTKYVDRTCSPLLYDVRVAQASVKCESWKLWAWSEPNSLRFSAEFQKICFDKLRDGWYLAKKLQKSRTVKQSWFLGNMNTIWTLSNIYTNLTFAGNSFSNVKFCHPKILYILWYSTRDIPRKKPELFLHPGEKCTS